MVKVYLAVICVRNFPEKIPGSDITVPYTLSYLKKEVQMFDWENYESILRSKNEI